jgi:hypothetical protein
MSHDPYAAPNVPQLLGLLEDGELNSEMADRFRNLIAAMENAAAETSGKTKVKGKMTITLGFVLQGGAYEISGDLKVDEPKRTPRRTVMYATEGNTLSRRQQNQEDMFMRDVNASKEPARIG